MRREEEGGVVLGARKVCQLDPRESYRRGDEEPPAHTRIAASDGNRYRELVEELREFLEAYRQAWWSFARGGEKGEPEPGVVFPRGTYKLRVEIGVRCVEESPG